MSIRTNPAKTAAGTIAIAIDVAGSPVNVELLDISPLTYEFDLIGSEDDVGVAGIQGEMQIRIDDRTTGASSAYDVMKADLGDYSGVDDLRDAPKANVNMNFTPTAGGSTYRFRFDVQFAGLSFDERTNSTTVRMIPRRPATNVKQWTENTVANPTPRINVFFWNGTAINSSNQNFATVGDFIDTLIKEVDPQAATNIYDTVRPQGHSDPSFPTRADVKFVTVAPANVLAPFIYGFELGGLRDKIYDLLPRFAGYEGAIFGSAFGVNFYMSRSKNNYNTTLGSDEIEDVKLIEGPTGLRQVQMNVTNSANKDLIDDYFFLGNGNGSAAAFPFGSQNIAQKIQDLEIGQTTDVAGSGGMIYVGNVALHSNVNTNAIPILDAAPDRGNRTIYLENVLNVGAREFALSRGVIIADDGSVNVGARVEMTVLGSDTVKPHQVIKFDSSLPGRFQGKHFRPSSLEYDLKADKIRITAYEIP